MALDYDLEYGLRYKSAEEVKHSGLYGRAVVEVDEAGRQVGEDMIPWGWTLTFQAFDLAVSDRLSFDSVSGIGNALSQRDMSHRFGIHAKLKPGHSNARFRRDTPTYRLFGTQRPLKEMTLDITPVADPADEGLTAWASASYMMETDFRNERQPDCLCFYFRVSQAVFDRYIWNLGQGLVTELIMSVGFVDGFYAEWSPSITTHEIKILASEEHPIVGAEGVDLPRIGNVGNFEVAMNGQGLLKRQSVPKLVEQHRDDPAPEQVEERPGFRWPGRR
jgi:hypothetical protein